jgi:di/tricarboxylate transporter
MADLSGDAWLSLSVGLGSLLVLASGRIAADVVMMGAMTLLLVCGVLSPLEALNGFANEGLMTIAALYVIAAALKQTGAVGSAARRLLGQPKGQAGMLLRMMLPTSLLSAFINNTPVVAMFLPAVQDWAKRLKQPASRLLLPLSYASILGGTCTLIGTSTNLVVNGLLIERGISSGLGIFDIAVVGLPLLLICTGFLTVASGWLLPRRQSPMEQLENAREYSVQMRITAEGPLCSLAIQEAGLRQLTYGYLVEIERNGRLLQAVSPSERLQADDLLLFIGTADAVGELRAIRGLSPADDQPGKLAIAQHQRRLVEAVIAPGGELAGKTVRSGRFRTHYNAVILSVSRNGERLNGKIGDLELRAGDTVLLETGDDFCREHGNSREFLLVHPLNEVLPAASSQKAWLAGGILLAMVMATAIGALPMLQASLIAAGALLLSGCIGVNAARRSVDTSVLTVIGASFALGQALTQTGAAQFLAGTLLGGVASPLVALAVVYALTTVFTEVVTNNAAAVLMFPIATAVAEQMGVSPMPFVVAIMFAASAAFMTPIGYQTNLMVYGPGGYRFTDYLRLGVPLSIIAGVVSVSLIPIFWPFS